MFDFWTLKRFAVTIKEELGTGGGLATSPSDSSTASRYTALESTQHVSYFSFPSSRPRFGQSFTDFISKRHRTQTLA